MIIDKKGCYAGILSVIIDIEIFILGSAMKRERVSLILEASTARSF